jgi:clan AA aspartic protease
MNGVVNAGYEAPLSIVIHGPHGDAEAITTVIDTGYNGFLALPLALIQRLKLNTDVPRVVTLGDNSQRVMQYFRAEVLWDGHRRKIRVMCAEGDPLLGTVLLRGRVLCVEFSVGGAVTVLPP